MTTKKRRRTRTWPTRRTTRYGSDSNSAVPGVTRLAMRAADLVLTPERRRAQIVATATSEDTVAVVQTKAPTLLPSAEIGPMTNTTIGGLVLSELPLLIA
jgi:hypothetical protein